MVTGLNHLTLAVSDLDCSILFYTELLGFALRMRKETSAYLEAGTLWLALVRDDNVMKAPLSEYSHAAFSVAASELPVLAEKMMKAGVPQWQEADRSDSFYFLDPDGHKLELHSGNLESRLFAMAKRQ
jgi:catechol 2,3-dioxygenase-like lactoylglutathione lyase family enzyme